MKLVALKRIHRYRQGDEFEVNLTQARVLKALGKAADAPDPVEPKPEAWIAEQSVMFADAIAPDGIAPRYRRRDMRSQE